MCGGTIQTAMKYRAITIRIVMPFIVTILIFGILLQLELSWKQRIVFFLEGRLSNNSLFYYIVAFLLHF